MSLEQELLPCAGKNLHSARPEAEKLPLCGSYSGLDAVQAKLLPESGSNSPSDISERDFFLQQEATHPGAPSTQSSFRFEAVGSGRGCRDRCWRWMDGHHQLPMVQVLASMTTGAPKGWDNQISSPGVGALCAQRTPQGRGDKLGFPVWARSTPGECQNAGGQNISHEFLLTQRGRVARPDVGSTRSRWKAPEPPPGQKPGPAFPLVSPKAWPRLHPEASTSRARDILERWGLHEHRPSAATQHNSTAPKIPT